MLDHGAVGEGEGRFGVVDGQGPHASAVTSHQDQRLHLNFIISHIYRIALLTTNEGGGGIRKIDKKGLRINDKEKINVSMIRILDDG